jgi:hypothetical protein
MQIKKINHHGSIKQITINIQYYLYIMINDYL